MKEATVKRVMALAAMLACLVPVGCGQEGQPASPSRTDLTGAAVTGEPATGPAGPTGGFAALNDAPGLESAQEPLRLPLKLPVSVWLDAQPPEILTAWNDPATHRVLTLDGFGKRAESFALNALNTTFEGSVLVREFDNARAHVSVVLHTKNAVCWGFQRDNSDTNPVAAFGYAPHEVAAGAAPSLGDGLFKIEFLIPWPTSRLPTYYETQPGDPVYPRLQLSHVVNCSGALRAGSGYPDGTPGAARTTQVGLFATGTPSGCPPERNANCYPSERIDWWPTGIR
jgi:hypothetical protein